MMDDPQANIRSIPQKRLSEHLRDAGAQFCLIPEGGKAPIGLGWQNRPQPLDLAFRHARAGGNVGLLTGRANLVILDFDRGWTDAVTLLPELAETIQTFRANAPDRRKFIVRVEGEMPPSRKTEAMEILARGRQGVIVGLHPSGARIEWAGERIVTVPAQDVIALWQEITGAPLHGDRRPDAGPLDADAVRRSLALAERVLDLAGVKHRPWRSHEGDGRKAILSTCPFNPPDNPHPPDDAAAILIGADGSIGATCHHARCQERIATHVKGGWSLLKEIAGYEKAEHVSARQHTEAVIDELRTWVREADFAEHVPIVHQAVNGYRTLATDKTVALAILDLCAHWGRLEHVPLSWRSVRHLVNVGSANTVGKAFIRLGNWFAVRDYGPFPVGQAPTWSIAPSLLAVAEDEIARCVDRAHSTDAAPPPPQSPSARDLRNLKAPLATHRNHDAFCQSLTPLTQEELEQRNAERSEAGALKMTRQLRRRLDAILPSLGRNCLIVVDALTMLGLSATRAALSSYTHLGECSISRCVRKLAELGLVEADRKIVTLRADWQLQLEQATPHMPTAGLSVARHIADLDGIIRNTNRLLNKEIDGRPAIGGEQRCKLERRISKAQATKGRLAKGEGRKLAVFDAAPNLNADEERARMERIRYAASRVEKEAPPKVNDWMLRKIFAQEIAEHGEELHAWMTVNVTGGNSAWWMGKTDEQIILDYKAMREAKANLTAPGWVTA